MKGIILAGGKATRLYPATRVICKQLLPVYDKPMIYYPLSTLLLSGIREVLIISSSQYLPRFKELLGDGSGLGIDIAYAIQDVPRGIADSFIVAEKFIAKERVCLILGDNIFYGQGLSVLLQQVAKLREGALVFGYYVKDPFRYGVIELGRRGRVRSLVEKPKNPKSNYAVTGIYFYDNRVVEIAKSLKPSYRKEIEISGVNNVYLRRGELKVKLLGRGYAWLDMGTYDSLIDASIFIKTMEERQGLKIGCLEEVAYRMGYINAAKLLRLAKAIPTSYGEYLKQIVRDEK